MAYRFIERGTGTYQLASGTLGALLDLGDVRSGTDRGDGGVGTLSVAGWTDVLTESYAADGAAATAAQLLYMIYSVVAQSDLDGTDFDSYKLDGSTVAMEFETTLNAAGWPVRRVRTG